MEDEKLNMSLRKFLKQLGVTAQQQIEEAVRASGKTSGTVAITGRVVAPDIGLDHEIDGELTLD
ncbi:MAG TPA: DUF6494 family protein [Aestuariivirgaceae bacterium]|nr:DUF6494 family protein [Aestuariivirgaceae bacterium]